MKYVWIGLLALTIWACQPREELPMTIIENVKGYTLIDTTLKQFGALAFEEGRVAATGRADQLKQQFKGAEVIDGRGKVLLPGLIDAHGHVMGLGYQQLQVNLNNTGSIVEALKRVEAYAESYPEVEWIEGRGWNHTHWKEQRFPTAADLDSVVADRPVWLSRVDGHAAWANSKAMEIADITAETPDPEDGKIMRDEQGHPTGVFVDAAEQLIEKHVPPPSEREQRLALEAALQRMREVGLTSAHDAGVDAETWQLYKQFADRGDLTTRIYAMISGTDTTFDKLAEGGPADNYAQNRLALRSVKLYEDGALGSRGAAMMEPYTDDPGNRGLLFHDEGELTSMIAKAADRGYQVNVHAIGDRANKTVLDAFANVRDSLGELNLRHRVEHAQIVRPVDIPRFRQLDLIASMQPTHATSDMNMAVDRIGEERMEGGYAWQKFLEQGSVLAAGSDFPVESANPFYGWYSAVTRRDHEGNPPGGWYPEQAMTRKQAFRAFTMDAAYAAHQEAVLGSLEKGKWADFILVDRDPFEVPAREIWQIEVLETWQAGEKVFDRSE